MPLLADTAPLQTRARWLVPYYGGGGQGQTCSEMKGRIWARTHGHRSPSSMSSERCSSLTSAVSAETDFPQSSYWRTLSSLKSFAPRFLKATPSSRPRDKAISAERIVSHFVLERRMKLPARTIPIVVITPIVMNQDVGASINRNPINHDGSIMHQTNNIRSTNRTAGSLLGTTSISSQELYIVVYTSTTYGKGSKSSQKETAYGWPSPP